MVGALVGSSARALAVLLGRVRGAWSLAQAARPWQVVQGAKSREALARGPEGRASLVGEALRESGRCDTLASSA